MASEWMRATITHPSIDPPCYWLLVVGGCSFDGDAQPQPVHIGLTLTQTGRCHLLDSGISWTVTQVGL
jgi:hypothetical protein